MVRVEVPFQPAGSRCWCWIKPTAVGFWLWCHQVPPCDKEELVCPSLGAGSRGWEPAQFIHKNCGVLEVISSHPLSSACGVCRLGFPYSTKPSAGSKTVPVDFGVVPVQALGFSQLSIYLKQTKQQPKNPLRLVFHISAGLGGGSLPF